MSTFLQYDLFFSFVPGQAAYVTGRGFESVSILTKRAHLAVELELSWFFDTHICFLALYLFANVCLLWRQVDGWMKGM